MPNPETAYETLSPETINPLNNNNTNTTINPELPIYSPTIDTNTAATTTTNYERLSTNKLDRIKKPLATLATSLAIGGGIVATESTLASAEDSYAPTATASSKQLGDLPQPPLKMYTSVNCSRGVGVTGPGAIPRPKFIYQKNSSSKLKVSTAFDSIEACNRHGHRRISYYQQQTNDGGKTWHRSSNIGHISGNQEHTINKVLKAPFDCKDKATTDVRGVFKINWYAKKGHGKNNVKYEYISKDNSIMPYRHAKKPNCK